jgi:ribosomal protein S18 acetylase RimI-like enzyme
MRIRLEPATPAEAPAIAALGAEVAAHLTATHGRGHWSSSGTERGVLYQMRISNVFVAKRRGRVIASLALGTRKPWAIDRKYFSPCKRPLYLTGMAVASALQRQGIGRQCMVEAVRIAREWPGDAIRLDAYDAAAGAGKFYRRCGFQAVGRASYRNTPLVYLEMMLV